MNKLIKPITLLLLTLAVLLNLNWLKSPYAGVILGLFYIIIFGYLFGKIIFPAKERSWQIVMGVFSLISLYSLLGAIVYYFYRLDQFVVSVIILIISLSIILLNIKSSQPSNSKLRTSDFVLRTSILTVSYLTLFAVAIIILFSCQTTEAIKSTWQVLPKSFFLIYQFPLFPD